MTGEDIQNIVEKGNFPGVKSPVKFIETHISWVILTPEFAFKVKKPVKFSFLDFSTIEKREFYCREEVRLNGRLSQKMYLDVLPVAPTENGGLAIGITNQMPIDFAVCMKRMDEARQMDGLLRQYAVSVADMEDLAQMLVRFHQSVRMKETPYRAGDYRADFDDLFGLRDDCVRIFGTEAAPELDGWQKKVNGFLEKHEERLHQRAESGFWVDGHGDLHARNIFLLPEGPVVFDCIEFNPHFRQLDVLNELAFLCMDLDHGGHHELSEAFMAAYCRAWPCIECPEDEQLFLYFKAYRANIRLKITLLEWQQHKSAGLENTAKSYWDLLQKYLNQL